MVELVGGGSDINRATPSSFSVSVLLLASVERFGVSRMRDLNLHLDCKVDRVDQIILKVWA